MKNGPFRSAIAAVLLFPACSAEELAAPSGVALDPVGAPARFGFELEKDDLSAALVVLLETYRATPADEKQASVLAERRRTALAYVQQRGFEATLRLIAELRNVPGTRRQATHSLIHLIGDVNTALGAEYLQALALRPLPERTVAAPEAGVDPRDVSLGERIAAVDALGRCAVQGNAAAKAALLGLVSRGDALVRRHAIEVYYRVSPQRWRAKRTLDRLLAPEDQWLLHEIH